MITENIEMSHQFTNLTNICKSALVISFLCINFIWAGNGGFSMHPVKFILNTSKGELSTKTSISYNHGDAPCPIEISIYERSIDENGNVVYSDIPTNDFAAFPGQMVLMPGERQIVQIQWVGNTPPAQEKQYSVIATQVPIQGLESSTASFKPIGSVEAIVKYSGVLLLTSDDFLPDVKINTFTEVNIEKNVSLKFSLDNEGTAMQKIDKFSLLVKKKNNQTVVIKPEFLINTYNGHSLFANEKRSVFIKWNQKFKISDITSIQPVFEIDD
ncbi:MAG: hypothetical protein OCD01_15830 [Fibrobacterales bacterium]